jgi:hypothetical protein
MKKLESSNQIALLKSLVGWVYSPTVSLGLLDDCKGGGRVHPPYVRVSGEQTQIGTPNEKFRNGMFRSCLCAAIAMFLWTVGCQNPNAGANARIATPYYGPTKTMRELVNRINTNNEKLPTIWASHYYEATIVDEQHKPHFVNGDGVLLYRSPTDLRLQGSKELIGTVFDMGTNANDYWLRVVPEIDTLWYGNFTDLTDEALATHQIPIQPDMILQVLGIGTIDANFHELPVPTLRFNNDARAYMMVWNTKLPDRWVAQREVWYDVDSLLPIYVFLFDANGRVILRARLSQHRQVEMSSLPEKEWPWMPGKYDLFFPENGSKMEFTLKDVMLQHGEGRRAVPNDSSFRRPAAGGSNEIPIR